MTFSGRARLLLTIEVGRVGVWKMEGMLSALFIFCVFYFIFLFYSLYDIFYHFAPVLWMAQHKAKGVCVYGAYLKHSSEWVKRNFTLNVFHCYFTVFSDHVCGCQPCYYCFLVSFFYMHRKKYFTKWTFDEMENNEMCLIIMKTDLRILILSHFWDFSGYS